MGKAVELAFNGELGKLDECYGLTRIFFTDPMSFTHTIMKIVYGVAGL